MVSNLSPVEVAKMRACWKYLLMLLLLDLLGLFHFDIVLFLDIVFLLDFAALLLHRLDVFLLVIIKIDGRVGVGSLALRGAAGVLFSRSSPLARRLGSGRRRAGGATLIGVGSTASLLAAELLQMLSVMREGKQLAMPFIHC
jgi:hypothetical protein